MFPDNVTMSILRAKRSRRSTVFVGLGFIVSALFLVANGRPLIQALLYIGMGVAESMAVVSGIRRHRPSCPGGWWSLAAGVVLSATANAVWYADPVVFGGTLPFPSVADGLFFVSYSCIAAGLVLLIRARSPRSDRAGALVDSALITAVAAFVAWLCLLGPTAASSTGPAPQRLVALGYPLFDLVLFALVTRMVFTRGARSPAFWYICAFVVLQLVGDTAYSLSLLDGTFGYDHVLVTSWLLSWTMIGAAALHPTMTTVGVATSATVTAHPMRRLAVVAGATLLVPGVALVHGEVHGTLLLVTALVLFTLAIARMAIIVQEVQAKAEIIEGRERELRATVSLLNESEEELARQARHDSLTGLPNRAHLLHRLDRALAHRDCSVAVMMLDLDGFKTVNDSLGHAAGDAMLVEVAARLTSAVRGSDLVARLGGDEFILLAECVDTDAAVEFATRVLDVLDAPMVVQARTLFCQASIGIALGSDQSHTAAELLRDADAAMYTAKGRGGQRYEVFSADMHARALEHLALANDLRGVALGTEMTLHYQPLVDLVSGDLSGFEALLRWDHPERGVIGPNDFIPIAEETGAILRIGRWVIGEACHQLASWHRSHAASRVLGMNVNVSARQLADVGIVDDVARVLAETGLDPALLTLEITETMIMADEDEVRDCLCRLKQLGVRISVDDFGTGYSSLGHLDRFPVDELKIDRSFVARMGVAGDESGVAAAAIRLARSLHIDVVAEGVETDEQLVELRRSSCTRAQGYLFSKALTADAAEVLLGAGLRRPLAPAPAPAILVVDDDDAVRETTCRVLRGGGFRTVAAATGQQALRAAATTRFDAVVLDVRLPDMDGYAVAERLAAECRTPTPIVYLSGAATESADRARGFDSGGDCYLLKPIAREELVAAVRAVLRGRSEQADAVPRRVPVDA